MAPALGDPPVFQHDYLVKLIEPVEVMGDEQGGAPGRDGEQVRGQRTAGIWLEVRGGLVEDQQRWIGEQRAGQREPLPLGWDTPVGAGGAALSGGQRQRLALARALLADPALLILDEPAAHLEPDTRRALTADLLAVTAGRTTLLITHDLDGLDQLDEIVVLNDGRVTERGSHAQLIRAKSSYQRLWRSGQIS